MPIISKTIPSYDGFTLFKKYFLDHKSIHIFDSKETSCEALDYFEKEAVDEQLKLENILFLDSRVWGGV